MFHVIQRLGVSAGLVALLLLSATLGTTQVAAQGEAGGINIYSYQCPEGFTGGDFTSCREVPLSGVGFTLFEEGQHSGIGATSDVDGVAHLGLPISEPATINLLVQPAAGYESSFVSCSEAYAGLANGISFPDVAPDAYITCEWFFTPIGGEQPVDEEPVDDADGSLIVQVYGCEKGAYTRDDLSACTANPLSGVNLASSAVDQDNGVGAVTNADGVAKLPLFGQDLPGDIRLSVALPGEYDRYRATCWDGDGSNVEFVPDGVSIMLQDVGDNVVITCGIYALPAESTVPDDREDPEIITTLPNTGAGDDGDLGSGTMIPILIGTILTLLAGLVRFRRAA